MAIGLGSSFKIYHDEVQTGFVETLQQETDAFNAASAGAIVMRPNVSPGDYTKEAFFKAITNLITRRDLTANPSTPVTDTPLVQAETVMVKINRKIGPVAQTRDAFRKIAQDPGEFSIIIGQMTAKAVAMDMLNTGLAAVVSALTGVSPLVHNVTAASPTDTISTDNLIQALFKAGDSANDIVLWAMHSASYAKLMRDQVANQQFDAVAGVVVAQGSPVTLNRPVLMTDSPALYTLTSPTAPVKVLGLRTNAIRLDESELQDIVVDDITGGEQLAIRIQGEFAYNLGVLGFTWDTVVGVNPTDANIAAAGSWDQVATSVKNLAGVLMIADVA